MLATCATQLVIFGSIQTIYIFVYDQSVPFTTIKGKDRGILCNRVWAQCSSPVVRGSPLPLGQCDTLPFLGFNRYPLSTSLKGRRNSWVSCVALVRIQTWAHRLVGRHTYTRTWRCLHFFTGITYMPWLMKMVTRYFGVTILNSSFYKK